MTKFVSKIVEDLPARFWAKVNRTPGCWEWTASQDQDGYGMLCVERVPRRAHRISWMFHFGAIPNGLQVNHHCDNRRCVRPDHLYLGTQAENMRDRKVRGKYHRNQ